MENYNYKSIEDYKKELMASYQKRNETTDVMINIKDNAPDITEPIQNNENNNTDKNNEISELPEVEIQTEKGTGTFRAEVHTADLAYPVANAKIKLFKDKELIAFLMTDSSGRTKKINIISPPESNSFEPENPFKYVQYTAEIFADDFITKKNMTVDAVGGADAILNANIVPVSERMS